jgi:HEAT repeat protein
VATATTEEGAKQEESLEAPLIEAALSTSSALNLRTDAITALGFIGTKSTIDKLKALLQPNNPMALPAAQAVAMIGVRQSSALADQVEDRLGEAGNMLIGLADQQKTNPGLGLAAAVALSNMEEIPVDKLISQLSSTSDEANRGWSAAILAAIGKPATEKVLRMRGNASKDLVQRQWLASTLQVIGDAMALQLMKHLPDEEKPQDAQVREIQSKVELIRRAGAQ